MNTLTAELARVGVVGAWFYAMAYGIADAVAAYRQMRGQR